MNINLEEFGIKGKMPTKKEMFDTSTEAEQDVILTLETLKELQDKMNGLKDEDVTKANFNHFFSKTIVEVESLLKHLLENQEHKSDTFKKHGTRQYLSRDN